MERGLRGCQDCQAFQWVVLEFGLHQQVGWECCILWSQRMMGAVPGVAVWAWAE